MRNIKEKGFFFIIFLYLIIGTIFEFNNYILYTKVINPIFWILVGIYLLVIKKINIRSRKENYYESRILICIVIYLLIYFFLGVMVGFGKNPYSTTFISILKNSFTTLIPIIGIELTRHFFILRNKKNIKIIILFTIILFFTELSIYNVYNTFYDKEMFFKYVCSYAIPLLTYNLLFSYLNYHSSCKLTLTFRLIKELMLIVLPIIPSLDWFVTGTLAIITSFAIFIYFKYKVFKINEFIKRNNKKTPYEKIIYIIVLVGSSFLVAFMLGFFKYEPIAILSNSMSPVYSRGDVLIYEKLAKDELQNIEKNSIIIYKAGSQYVAHRVIEIKKEDGNVSYRTKGDNNNAPDSKYVESEQIIGVYVRHIKYVGFPSVWLNDYFSHEEAVVETK